MANKDKATLYQELVGANRALVVAQVELAKAGLVYFEGVLVALDEKAIRDDEALFTRVARLRSAQLEVAEARDEYAKALEAYDVVVTGAAQK